MEAGDGHAGPVPGARRPGPARPRPPPPVLRRRDVQCADPRVRGDAGERPETDAPGTDHPRGPGVLGTARRRRGRRPPARPAAGPLRLVDRLPRGPVGGRRLRTAGAGPARLGRRRERADGRRLARDAPGPVHLRRGRAPHAPRAGTPVHRPGRPAPGPVRVAVHRLAPVRGRRRRRVGPAAGRSHTADRRPGRSAWPRLDRNRRRTRRPRTDPAPGTTGRRTADGLRRGVTLGRGGVRGGGRGRLRRGPVRRRPGARSAGAGRPPGRRSRAGLAAPRRSGGAGEPVRGCAVRAVGAGRGGAAGPQGLGPSGDGRVTGAEGDPGATTTGPDASVPSLVDSDPDDAYGDWVPFDPPSDGSARAEDREWVTVDGVRFRDSDVETRPLVGADHRFEGRESMPDDGRRRLRERRLRLYRGMRERTHVVRVGDAFHTVGAEETAPDPEASVYTFHAHGVPGGLKLAGKDGRVLLLGAEDGGRYIGGLPEVVARAAGDALHVASCYGAVAGDPLRSQSLIRPAPLVEDPLEEVALAQHAANYSGRTTTAATGRTGYNDSVRLLAATPEGTLARMETFLPEPVGATAELAEAAGLRPLPRPAGLPAWDDEAPRALRLTRALRLVFGNDVEADRGVPGGRYERLLRGIGALETLRANDPALSGYTPLRMELWQLLVPAPDGGAAPGPADFEAVLDRALAAPGDAALTDVWD
uniref:lonely Cys domain-containing protein n=1 Tax=Streptomyces sp. rh45 TaxID=3028726 RepID=UPI003C7D18C2